ncbi:hypothetical protein [Spiroplasma diminutum]|uniref:Uncharacterized protein n=1 Tax=Spiroplasma diminutum CUAS-1 TaxID=1276221 RepID=S5M2Y1_9MOLU|nr:hypothetical protein [Spiroplasma diminutum]AGR42437.1 hypothetical protein SDIMI_v3c07330 [Spiroplasma diminutum CUAS-1]
MELIKVDKKDYLEIPSYSILAKRDGKFQFEDFDFIKLDIPSDLVEEQNQINLTYSASYNIAGEGLKPHTNVGTIKIDRRNLTQHKYFKNQCDTTIANLAYGQINYDFNNRYKRHYFDILRSDIKINIEQRAKNTIDPIMKIENNYSLWGLLDLQILGAKMKSFFEMYAEGLNRTDYLQSKPKLKSNFDFSEFYKIKKLTDKVEINDNGFEITNTNITNYNISKVLVEESQDGYDGIVWNPLYNNLIIYNRELDYNSKLFSIDFVSNINNKKIFDISYDNKYVNEKYKYQINLKISDLNKIGWKNKQEIINYINEKEKIS